MTATQQLLRRPSEILSRANEMFHPRAKSHSTGIGGVLMLAIAICAFIWLFPEMRRYARISRM